MRRSLTRIRTSHVGRLPPPKGWADMPARLAGAEITDPVVIAAKVTPAYALAESLLGCVLLDRRSGRMRPAAQSLRQAWPCVSGGSRAPLQGASVHVRCPRSARKSKLLEDRLRQ